MSNTCSQCDTLLPFDGHFCPRCGTPVPGGAEVEELLASSASDPTGLLDRLREATEGEFTIIRELGRGGMGRVMLAHEVVLDRRVAMKVLPPALADHSEIVERFQREARTAGKLSHPNIVGVYQVYERSGLTFFTMPYVAGPSLREVLRKTPEADYALVRRYLSEAADGLGYAHAKGVIHRDIKPENMLIEGSRDGRLMLTDFGIAKALGLGTTLTRPGDLMGTPYYMSPEQCSEKDGIDPRSDQYSLGLVGYEMVAGKFPFTADSMAAIVYRHLHEYPEPLETVRADVPDDLREVIWRAIQKDKNDRFPTMYEFLVALGAPAARPVRLVPKPSRRRGPAGWLAAALVVLALVSAGVVYQKSLSDASSNGPATAALARPSLGEDEGADAGATAADSVSGDTVETASGGNEVAEPQTQGGAARGGAQPAAAGEADTRRQLMTDLANRRSEAGAARQRAVDAGAGQHFPGRFAVADSILRAGQAAERQGRIRLAIRDFERGADRFVVLAGFAEQRNAELAAADSAAGDTVTGGEGETVVAGPADTAVPPAEAIASLIEVYRAAFEAEDLEAMRRDVYRGTMPSDEEKQLKQMFDRAEEISATIETERMNIQGDRANVRLTQTMDWRLSRDKSLRTDVKVGVEMKFARDDSGWRLLELRLGR